MPERHRKQRAPRLKRKRVAHIPGYVPEAEMAGQLGVAVRTLGSGAKQASGRRSPNSENKSTTATLPATLGCGAKRSSLFDRLKRGLVHDQLKRRGFSRTHGVEITEAPSDKESSGDRSNISGRIRRQPLSAAR
jgi:hypothetical protein